MCCVCMWCSRSVLCDIQAQESSNTLFPFGPEHLNKWKSPKKNRKDFRMKIACLKGFQMDTKKVASILLPHCEYHKFA